MGAVVIGTLLLAYLALLFATAEWRASTRALLTRTPWRTIAQSAFPRVSNLSLA
jgi:hypothetical protein